MRDRALLPLTADVTGLAADAARFTDDEWIPHFNQGIYEGEWSGVALRSVGGVAGQLYPDPTAQDDFADTPLLARCPNVRAFLGQLQCLLQSVRFLRLAPGARIKEHKDYNLGYDDGEVRLHVPVTTSADVEFLLGGTAVPMQPGEVWYLDLNNPHAVTNAGTTPRVHLVVDCTVDPWLDSVLRSGM